MQNTIIAGNTAGTDGADIWGLVTSLGHNLVGNDAGASGFVSSDLLNIDPLLGPLADNAGPTLTHALLAGSAAIDAANTASAPGTDQRGVARPVGPAADMGAYEFVPARLTIAESGGSTDVVEGGATDSYTVVLDSQPTADVAIKVHPDDQLDLGAGARVAISLVFTPANWDAPQTITVAAVLDGVADGSRTGLITHSATSADADYNGSSIPSVTANISESDGSMAGVKWHDLNGDGLRDTGEPLLAGWTIYLDQNNNRQLDPGELSTVTQSDDPNTQEDETGRFAFAGLPVGSYIVAEVIQPGWVQTSPGNQVWFVELVEGQAVTSLDFGNRLPHMSIDDVSLTEGNSGTTAASFTVTLSQASTETVTVDYSTLAETATAGTEYVAASGTLTFAPGETSKTISVSINGDTDIEPDEMFRVELANASLAWIADTQGVAAVLNDDVALTLTVAPTSIRENGGTATLTVTRGGETSQDVVVALSSSDTTELTLPSTVTIAAGQASVTAVLTAVDDSLLDGTQSVTITGSASGYQSGSDTVFVLDHETLTMDFGATTLAEDASSMSVTITRSNTDVEQALTVSITEVENPLDINMPSSVTIPSGQRSVTFNVSAFDDVLVEPTETAVVSASAVGYFGSSVRSVDILDNDAGPFAAGNVLVSTRESSRYGRLTQYTPAGRKVQEFTVIHPNDPNNETTMRDVIADRYGVAHVVNGSGSPVLATVDPETGSFVHHDFPGWSTHGNISYGGVTAYNQFVFVTDITVGDEDFTQRGLIRFDTTDFSAQRFADYSDFYDVTIGLDGYLYSWGNNSVVYVFDPVSLEQVRPLHLIGGCSVPRRLSHPIPQVLNVRRNICELEFRSFTRDHDTASLGCDTGTF